VSEQLHTVRFKRGSVEFELTSTAAEIAEVRRVLEPAFFAALSRPARDEKAAALDHALGSIAATAAEGAREPRRPRSPRRLETRETLGRAGVWEKLLGAELDEFPVLGDRPDALYAAYALLRWARDTLNLDGLTAHEIQAFLTMKLHLPYASEAYAASMIAREPVGEVEIIGDHPKVYRLTKRGERFLRADVVASAAGRQPTPLRR
jgi:hypothetical protein